MAGPVYKLQILSSEDGKIATFHGRGPVERDLVQAITAAILAKGSWWLRKGKLAEAIAQGIDDALMDAKREASAKHFG